jgi:isopropylmalate/homocitrate/citramalate synthase
MRTKKRWQGDISASELPEPFKVLADLIGIDNTLILAGKLGGSNIYIPKINTLYRGVRDKKICDEFNGKNYASLAKKYGVTERRVRNIIKENMKKGAFAQKKNKPDPSIQQQRLFYV